MAAESTAKSDAGPPLPSLVERCLLSVEGLVLHRPQELPAVVACLGVLPRSAVSQFVESLLLKSMTGLYLLPSLLGRLHDCFPATLLADCTLTCRNRGHLKQFRLQRGWWESSLACAPYFCDGCQVITCHDELSQCVCDRWLCELCSRFESFFWKWGNLRGRVCAEGCPSKVAQRLMKRKRRTTIGPDLAWCERDDLTPCFNCGCTIWLQDMGEYRKGMTNDEIDEVESSGFFLSCHVCGEQSCCACVRDCPECSRFTCKRCRAPCSSCGKKRVCRLCLRPREADEVSQCWDCQDQDRA